MIDRFFSGVVTPEFTERLPAPIIAIEPMNIKTLATYRIVPDGYGLPFKLTMNEVHYKEVGGKMVWKWGEWSQSETLFHELMHHLQQLRGKDPYKQGSRVTHNKEFCSRMEAAGLHPTPGVGSHYAVADADSPFGMLMKEWGIERPKDVPRDELKPKQNWWVFGSEGTRGKSTLFKWMCAVCGLAIRVGIKDDPHLIHKVDCGQFVKG